MKNKRVKYLALSEQYPPQKGGHIIWFYEICNRLGEVTLVTRFEEGYQEQELNSGVKIFRVFMRRIKWCIPESLPIYLNLFYFGMLRGNRQSDVVISARVIPEGMVGVFISFFLKIQNIVIVHGEEINRLKLIQGKNLLNNILLFFKKKAIWWVLKNTDLVIANSKFTNQLLLDGGIAAKKVRIVYPGTDPFRFSPKKKNLELLRRFKLFGKTVLLSIGRLTPRKGQDMTIRALPKIIKKYPEVVYLIVGNGEYEKELKILVREFDVEKHVIFCGSVSDDMLPDMYNLCDLFLMPNRTMEKSNDVEGFGIVFLEANACEKPVIGGLSGGVPDSVVDGRSGVLISADSPETIANTVVELLSDREKMRKMGRLGRQRVMNELTWEHSSDNIARYVADLFR